MRWQNDAQFVDWLVSSEYAARRQGKVVPYISDGLVIYCWEAFLAGRQAALAAEGK